MLAKKGKKSERRTNRCQQADCSIVAEDSDWNLDQ
jgi:hypothetical protein